MDLGHLENLVSKIQLKKEMVKGIAEYCVVNNKGNENQIAKILEREFKMPASSVEQQLAILDVMSEILIMTGFSEKKDVTFFKPFAQKVKNFIEEISGKVKDVKADHLSVIPIILKNWSIPGKELFVPNFMEKLRKAADPIMEAALKAEENKKNGIFKNYTKTFLTEYEEVKANNVTGQIYENLAKYEQIMKETNLTNQEIRKISLEELTPEMKERAKELHSKAQKEVDKLIDVMCKFQTDFYSLREACREQFEKLPAEVKNPDNN